MMSKGSKNDSHPRRKLVSVEIPKKTYFDFLALPLEIRNMIYRLVLKQSDRVWKPIDQATLFRMRPAYARFAKIHTDIAEQRGYTPPREEDIRFPTKACLNAVPPEYKSFSDPFLHQKKLFDDNLPLNMQHTALFKVCQQIRTEVKTINYELNTMRVDLYAYSSGRSFIADNLDTDDFGFGRIREINDLIRYGRRLQINVDVSQAANLANFLKKRTNLIALEVGIIGIENREAAHGHKMAELFSNVPVSNRAKLRMYDRPRCLRWWRYQSEEAAMIDASRKLQSATEA